MEKVGAERGAIETQLADTELYSDENKDKLKKLLTDQAYLQKELDQAEADWLQATEAYEELSQSLKASE
jgi:ATP-binding cassette subfamily F protein 3